MQENQNPEIEVNETQIPNIQVEGDAEYSEEQKNSYAEFDMEKLTDEEKARIDEINDLIKAESLDTTTAMNIIINAVQVSYDKEHFNDLDRYLIAKSLTAFKELSDKGEDIVIKTV
jgi:hypothetical protein